MKKPNVPIKPNAPIKPIEPLKTYTRCVVLKTLYFSDLDLNGLNTTLQTFLLHLIPEGEDINNLFVQEKEVIDWESSSIIGLEVCKTIDEPDPKYASKLNKYNKELVLYNKKMEQYQKDLDEYNKLVKSKAYKEKQSKIRQLKSQLKKLQSEIVE